MPDNFDAYYEWLGIPPKHQPPNHYRLLGIELFEENANVIERGADRQMTHVRTFQSGKHAKESQRLLNELSTARICLLNPQRKAEYDGRLRAAMQSAAPPVPPANSVAVVPTDAGIPLIERTAASPSKSRRVVHESGITTRWIIEVAAAVISIVALAIVILIVISRGHRPADESPRTATANIAPISPPVPPNQSESVAPIKTETLSASSSSAGKDGTDPPTPTAPPPRTEPAEASPVPPPADTAGPAKPPESSPTEDNDSARPLRFAGRQSMLVKGSASLLDLSGNFTAEIWFRPGTRTPPAGNYLFGTASFTGSVASESGMAGWQVLFVPSAPDASDVKLIVRWGRQTGKSGEAAVFLGPLSTQWHHLALCAGAPEDSDPSLQVWLDGKQSLRQRILTNDLRPSTSDLCLGAQTDGPPSWAFVGDVRGLRLSSAMLYESEFTPRYDLPREEATDCLLDFRNPATDRLPDLSEHKRDGVITGATRPDPESGPITVDAELLARLPQPAPTGRQPVPPRDVVAKELAKLREALKKELSAAKEQADMVTLSVELIRKSREASTTATRYATLSESLELAIKAGNAHLAMRVVSEMDAQFGTNIWSARADALSKLQPEAKTYADRRVLVETAIVLIDRAMGKSEVSAADRFASLAQKASGRVKDPLLSRLATLRARDLAAGQKLAAQAEAAKRQLAGEGGNPEANEALGRYLFFVCGDQENGLKCLAQGKDATLQELARKEQGAPESPDQRLELGVQWMNWAKTAAESEQNVAWLRAQHWLGLSLPQFSGTEQARAAKLLEDVSGKAVPRSLAGSSLVDDWMGKPVGEMPVIQAHSGAVTALTPCRSGRWIVSASADGLVRAFDPFNGQQLGEIQSASNGISAVALLPDERLVMVSGSRNAIEVWNLLNKRPVREVPTDAAPHDLHLSDDGKVLLWFKSAENSQNIVIADPVSGAGAMQLDCPGTPTRLALAPSGKLAGVVNHLNGLGVFSLATGQRMVLPGPTEPIGDIAFSPDNRLLACCSATEIIIWDLANGKPVHKLARSGPPGRLSFLPDAARLIESGAADELSVWNSRTGALIATLKSANPTGAATTRMSVLPHGLAAVVGASNGEIKVWRLPDE